MQARSSGALRPSRHRRLDCGATQTYRVYVDSCITPGQRAELLAASALAAESAVFEGNVDGTHYVCATCSTDYSH